MALSTLPETTPASTRPAVRKLSAGKPSSKNGNTLRLGLTLLLVAFLFIGLFRMFAKPPAPVSIMVVAAGNDLAPGCKLGFRDLHLMNVPKSYFREDMLQTFPELAGAYTNTFIPMGEPILKSQLMASKSGLQFQLKANQRAFTLRLNDDQMVDHEIRCGDRIDIVVTSSAGSKQYTKTVCQDIPVLLATPKEILTSDKLRSSENNKITLALSPEDVEKVAQASETSKIRLVLRNSQSRMTVALQGADARDLLPPEALRVDAPLAKTVAAPPPFPTAIPLPPPPMPVSNAVELPSPVQWVVDVFKGATKESQTFEQKQ